VGGITESERGTYKRPRAAPGISLEENELAGRARITDSVYRRLVEVHHQLVLHVVVLVVGIENNLAVILEAGSDRLPPRLEAGGIGDDLVVVASKVMGV